MFGSLQRSSDGLPLPPGAPRHPPSIESNPPFLPGPSYRGSAFPPELIGAILRFVSSSRVFFNFFLLCKRVKSYIENEDPTCASNIAFTVRTSDPNQGFLIPEGMYDVKTESGPLGSGLNFPRVPGGPRGPGGLSSGCETNREGPIAVPIRLIQSIQGVYPETEQLDVYSFPFSGESGGIFSKLVPGGRSSTDDPTPPVISQTKSYVVHLKSNVRLGGGYTADQFRTILGCFPNLRHLDVRRVNDPLPAFRSLSQSLISLDIHECGISDGDFAMDGLKGLRRLRIRACGEEGAITTGLFRHLPHLEKIEVECILKTFKWKNSDLVHAAHSLRKLVLSNVTPGDSPPEGSIEEGAFGTFQNLEVLILNRVSFVSDNAFKGLSRSVRKLIVNHCGYVSGPGIRNAVGEDVFALIEDVCVKMTSPEPFDMMGDMMAPSNFQREKFREAVENRRNDLGSRFQLKHLV